MRVNGASLALALSMVVTACGDGSDSAAPTPPATIPTTVPQPTTTSSTEGNEGGFGAPSQAPGEFDGFTAESAATGTLRLADNGCWYAELNGVERLAVFPVGFQLNPEEGGELIDGDGDVYRSGDRFDSSAVMVPRSEIPGGEDGRWGNYMSLCQPKEPELAVFDTFAPEFDPSLLNDEELTRMVEEAEFTEDWPCGRGWAVSTSDQRVAIAIYAATGEVSGTGGPVELPDPNWTAELLVGKNLFAQHCNDALEQWVALPMVVAEWTLTNGTLTPKGLLPEPADPPTEVSATLEGGRINTVSGPISLPSLDLTNKEFNLFAG